ncbi:MAG: hypothetical protein KC619_13155 [Myxococcales bacterium]|nr:hypothetical protein [Myxococcales bacterium]
MTLPRLERYLARLPDGWASYPECTIKATLVQAAFAAIPEGSMGRLPAPLLARASERVLSTSWAPEVEMIAIIHAAVDLRSETPGGEAALWEQVTQENVALFQRKEYRPLIRAGNPGRAIEHLSRSWNLFHRGTTFECLETTPGRVVLLHTYPHLLFPSLALRMRSASLQGILIACGATDADMREEALGPGRTRYVATWAVTDDEGE